MEGGGASVREKRTTIFIGPELGTVSWPELVVAAREAGDSGIDVVVASAFNYEAEASEFDRRVPSTVPSPAASPSRSSTTLATR